jgi:hypothetical protein
LQHSLRARIKPTLTSRYKFLLKQKTHKLHNIFSAFYETCTRILSLKTIVLLLRREHRWSDLNRHSLIRQLLLYQLSYIGYVHDEESRLLSLVSKTRILPLNYIHFYAWLESTNNVFVWKKNYTIYYKLFYAIINILKNREGLTWTTNFRAWAYELPLTPPPTY